MAAREHGTRWDLSAIELPSVLALEAAAMACRPSIPGPSGVSFSAWVSVGRAGAQILHRDPVALAGCVRSPKGFADSLSVFIHEGSEEGGAADVARPVV